MEKFKIAIVQENPLGNDYKKNTDYGIEIVKKAKKLGADMVLFPERFITGYKLPIDNVDAISENSIYIKRFCETAGGLKIGIVITGLTKGVEKPRNTAFVIDRCGKVIMKYNKVHTCDFAKESCLESGTEFKVCSFDGIKIGVMICYDREYPESARVLMLEGAELILVPSNCGSMKPRVQALSTRAYENMVGVVMANAPGKNCGSSCAFSPICWDEDGNTINNAIFLADDVTSDIFMAEYDIDELRNYRNHEMMGNTFRKVKSYGKLLSGEIHQPFIR